MKKLLTLAALSCAVVLAGCTAKPEVEEPTEAVEPTVEATATPEVAPEAVAPEAVAPEAAPEAVPAAEAVAE